MLVAAASLAALASCGKCSCSGPADPEAEVRATMQTIQAAAATRRVSILKDHISEDYRDPDGRDRQALAGLLTFHYMRHRSHHVLAMVREVVMDGDEDARVEAYAALAGQKINAPADLANMSANLFHFTFFLRKEDGDWRCIRTAWERAIATDFL